MSVEYTQDSPYANTEMHGEYLDIMAFRTIPPKDDDVVFTISMTYKYRPDLLAGDLYNNTNLWWVFQMRNPNTLVDPIYDFDVGLKIYIPKQETIEQALGL